MVQTGDVRWNQTHQFALEAIITTDQQGLVTTWNPQAESYFGWQPEEVAGKPFIEVLFHSEPDNELVKSWSEIRRCDKGITGRRVFLDVSAKHRLGHEVIIEIAITCVKNRDANEFLIFIRNITDIRLSESASRIASVAFQSLEGMVIMDARRVILRVNKAFTDITGYEHHEAAGKYSAIFREGRQDEDVYHELRRTLAETHFWQGEIWDRRKNGERYSAWLRVTAVVGADQQITHYVAAFIDLSEQQAAAQRINYLDFHDSLTGLPNRRFFLDRICKALAAGRRRSQFCAVLLLDVDDFKSINDTMGHGVGDELLIQIGRRLRSSLHEEDTVARLGGDEFAVVLESLEGDFKEAAGKVNAVGSRMVEVLGQAFQISGLSIDITVSIGISIADCSTAHPDSVLKESDIALYKAKNDGRSCMRFFDGRHQLELESRFSLIKSMREGFPEQFFLNYQLQVDGDLEPVAAEVLLRWTPPGQGPISPATFIPLAEESGFIVTMGTWVLEQACQMLAKWAHAPLTRELSLSVNVSARQFYAESFVPTVLRALASSGANPNLLKLELTEGLMLNHINDASEKMRALRRHGVRFSLDDFGTGYSSLSYLKGLPFEQLKIDQAFVRDIETDANDLAIASAIVALGRALGMQVVAEGVENEHQHAILKSLGCNVYQGYFISRPTSADRMLKEVRSRAVTETAVLQIEMNH